MAWWRSAWHLLLLLWTALHCWLAFLGLGRNPDVPARAAWLHRWCGKALARLHVNLQVSGPVPPGGLIVSNHLSYLDIMVFSAIAPCVFVSKREVRGWPLFGRLATLAGTVYVDRARASDTPRVNDELAATLTQGVRAVLFPEGTSSDGRQVLPFRSPLLEAAVATESPVTAAYLEYAASDSDVGQDVCYWGDMTFVPHLFRLLSKRNVQARVRFAAEAERFTDRKIAATRMRERVLTLRASER